MFKTRRDFLSLVGTGITFSLLNTGCSSKIPEESLATWNSHNYDDIRYVALSYALLAPSAHNLQSWKVKMVDEDTVLLFCDTNRLLPQTDPLNRQIMISQGAFLEFFKIAAQNFGYETIIEFPIKDERNILKYNPIAKITLAKNNSLLKDKLFDLISSRVTNRNFYKNIELSNEQINYIKDSIANYPVEVVFSSSKREKDIAKKAWLTEFHTPAKMLETYKYIRIGDSEINKYRDEICINDPIVRFLDFTGLFDRNVAPKTDGYAVRTQINEFNEKIDSTNNFLYLLSKENDRLSQIKIGMAYARVQLVATKMNLSLHPLSQALQEYEEQKESYSAIHSIIAKDNQTIQMWCRIGIPKENVNKSPRRDIKSFIV